MALKIAFIMDPFEKLDDINEDTSCCLITECLRRGYEVFYLQIKDLELQGKKAWGRLGKILEKEEDRFIIARPQMMRLDKMQAIFVRKDPPFDLDYLYSTYILEYVSPPTLIINSPRGIREANEKLYILNFPLFAPGSLVSKKPEQLKKFLSQIGGKMILKPLDDCSGRGVLCLQEDDINLNSLLEMATEQGNKFLMAQEYLPQIKEGDKRILVLEGKPMGAMRRVPPPDDYRANIHRGAKFVAAKITPFDHELCKCLSKRLLKDGIYFTGVDVLGEKILEINVTSPAGIPEINKLDQVHLEKVTIDWLEKKIGE